MKLCSDISIGVGNEAFNQTNVELIKRLNAEHIAQALITGSKLSFVNKDFIFVKDGFLFRINESYYGFFCDKHFFDAPFIQWAMLFAGVYSICYGIKMFIAGLYSYVK